MWIEGVKWVEVLDKGLYPPEKFVLEPAVKDILNKDIKPFYNVLDAGCGEGRFSLYAKDLGAIVTAIDIDQECIDAAIARGVQARYGDLTKLNFTDAAFDYFICSMVLNTMPNYEKAISELGRVLRSTGQGLIAVLDPHFVESDGKQHSDVEIIRMPFKGGVFNDIYRPFDAYTRAIQKAGMEISYQRSPETHIEGFPRNEYLLLKVRKVTDKPSVVA